MYVCMYVATSLDGLKKSDRYPGSLRAYFEQAYGFTDGVESASFKAAMENYISSMAAYAVVTYLLGIKDRCGRVNVWHC